MTENQQERIIDLFRSGIMYMEFLGHTERDLTSSEKEWLREARQLLDEIEREE